MKNTSSTRLYWFKLSILSTAPRIWMYSTVTETYWESGMTEQNHYQYQLASISTVNPDSDTYLSGVWIHMGTCVILNSSKTSPCIICQWVLHITSIVEMLVLQNDTKYQRSRWNERIIKYQPISYDNFNQSDIYRMQSVLLSVSFSEQIIATLISVSQCNTFLQSMCY